MEKGLLRLTFSFDIPGNWVADVKREGADVEGMCVVALGGMQQKRIVSLCLDFVSRASTAPTLRSDQEATLSMSPPRGQRFP